MKIILLNGPPRVGKDTAAHAIRDMLFARDVPCRWERFSMPFKHAFAGMMQVSIDEFGNVDGYEANKEMPIMSLGVSYRQWQIDFSEKLMKPQYGNTVFARLFVERVATLAPSTVVVVPDCGFQIEADVVLDAFRAKDVLLIQIYRPDCTFAGDSREYVSVKSTSTPGRYRCCFAPVLNYGTEAEYRDRILAVVEPFLTPLGANHEHAGEI